MPKDADLRTMNRADLEDEVMLLRAQVKVLQDWVRLARGVVTIDKPEKF